MITLEDVHYRYNAGSFPMPSALNGVTLTIHEGEFLAIIGSNGSGKSTLARCLNGLFHPSQGRIVVDDMETTDALHTWEIHRRVGMIFQNPDNQLVSTTVERELAFGLENLGLPSSEIQDRVHWALDRFNLNVYRLSPPHRLSGGQKQRLAIAAVVAMRPRYLVCDEPTALLDPQGRKDTISLIRQLRHDLEMTIVYITQLSDETAIADRVVLMDQGKIIQVGRPEELLTATDRLTSFGLGVPLPVKLAGALRMRNLDIMPDVLHPDDLLNAVKQLRPSPASASSDTARPSFPATAIGSSPIIEMRQVTHTYQPDTVLAMSALNKIDLEINEGECLALIGPNGSGKSTLIQHLNGLLTPTEGMVLVNGRNLAAPKTDLKSIRQQIGLVFQFPEMQLFEETVFNDIAFGPRNVGIEETNLKDRVYQALEQVQLDPNLFADRVPFSLSSGEKRRVAIAGILAMQPRVLALDEPTAGLDHRSIRQIEHILTVFKESGGTVIIISHDMDLVARLADRVVVLNEGQIVADAPPDILFRDRTLLESLGLECPGLVQLLMALNDSGYPVNTTIFDVEMAADEICKSLDLGA